MILEPFLDLFHECNKQNKATKKYAACSIHMNKHIARSLRGFAGVPENSSGKN